MLIWTSAHVLFYNIITCELNSYMKAMLLVGWNTEENEVNSGDIPEDFASDILPPTSFRCHLVQSYQKSDTIHSAAQAVGILLQANIVLHTLMSAISLARRLWTLS